ncbi:hypothetical protein DFH06DRAFT_1317591 [Mycena polygramma]|nr:hypothetical protein DFH06DRAFT_1317591 [Mycena polygramma]
MLASIYWLGCLGAGLSNITVDDADPQMIWAWNGDTPETVHCVGACLANGWDTSRLYNGSVSVTQEDTVAQYRFVGTAVYIYFSAPASAESTTQTALFLVDGDINTQSVSTIPIPASQAGNYGMLVYSVTGLEDKLHILTISDGPFSFDYLTYTQVSVVTSTVPQQTSPQPGDTSTPPPQTSPATSASPPTTSDLSTQSSPAASPSANSSSSVLSAFTLPASLALASGDSSLLASATSSFPAPTTSAANSQSAQTARKFPVGAVAGAAVAAVVAVICLLVALFLCLRARKSTAIPAVGENEPKIMNENGISPSLTVEDQLRQLQAQVELLRRDPAAVRDSAISGTSVARSLSTMKSDQTRAVLGQSYDHSTVRDSYLQTEGGLALRPELDAGPPRYEQENGG